MNLEEFKRRVVETLGPDLERATPANVREFVCQMQVELGGKPGLDHPLELDEPASSYEQVVREFYGRVLNYPPEEALIVLWLTSLEQAFAEIESLAGDMLARLLEDCDPPGESLDLPEA